MQQEVKLQLLYSDDIFEMYTENNTQGELIEWARLNLENEGKEINYENAVDEAETRLQEEYDYMKSVLRKEWNSEILAIGMLGLWNGSRTVVGHFPLWAALQKCFEDCNSVCYDSEEGVLVIEATHHDGTNKFVLRPLSAKALKWLESPAACKPEKEVCQYLQSRKDFTRKLKLEV